MSSMASRHTVISASRRCKRPAEDQLRVTTSKKQKLEVIETASTVSAKIMKVTKVKVFPLFNKTSIKNMFRFLDRQGNGTVLHGVNLNPQARVKVAAFDLDGTLIATKSGMIFPKDAGDWVWWHESIPSRLKALHENGYAIVIISNQGGLSRTVSKKRDEWELKIAKIAKQLPDVPFHIFAATKVNEFRKPDIGMWGCLTVIYAKQGVVPDLSLSFYVGDAAGRAGDHSNSDRGLANGIGLPFHTPEEFFLADDPSTPPLAERLGQASIQ